MSGHNKWSQIKFQKSTTDLRRGRLFSKLANTISAAVKQGGADSASNLRLRLLLEQAKRVNLPKENIERAIKRGSGQLEGLKIEELLFEAYGPGGIAILIEATTDNKNRITAEIRSVLNRLGGKLAESGSVAYLFEQQGVVTIFPSEQEAGMTKEQIELKAIDAGATDIEEQDGNLFIYTTLKELDQTKRNLEEQGIKITEVKLSFEPKSQITVSNPENANQILKLMEILEELDDVTAVYSNFDIPAGLIE